MRVLVTGTAGFIGNALALHFEINMDELVQSVNRNLHSITTPGKHVAQDIDVQRWQGRGLP